MQNNDSNHETLLPCPFCGAEPELRSAEDGGRYVGCPKCECATRLTYPLGTDVAAAVAECWNGRARPVGAPGQEPRQVVSSSEWLCEVPPATPDSEGWRWVMDDMEPRQGPKPALVSIYDGELHVQKWGWDYSILATRCALRWGPRLAVPGTSPSDALCRPADSGRGAQNQD